MQLLLTQFAVTTEVVEFAGSMQFDWKNDLQFIIDFSFSTGLAAQTAQKQKFRTTKRPLMQDWGFRLGINRCIRNLMLSNQNFEIILLIESHEKHVAAVYFKIYWRFKKHMELGNWKRIDVGQASYKPPKCSLQWDSNSHSNNPLKDYVPHFTAVEEVLIIQKNFVKFFGPRMFIRT